MGQDGGDEKPHLEVVLQGLAGITGSLSPTVRRYFTSLPNIP